MPLHYSIHHAIMTPQCPTEDLNELYTERQMDNTDNRAHILEYMFRLGDTSAPWSGSVKETNGKLGYMQLKSGSMHTLPRRTSVLKCTAASTRNNLVVRGRATDARQGRGSTAGSRD